MDNKYDNSGLTKRAINLLLNKQIGSDESPFILKDEELFLRYDSIHIVQEGNLVLISFKFHDEVLFVKSAICDLSNGEQLHLIGLNGTMDVRIG